jgi:L-ribulose-5-phosphate 4-epimerase
VPLARALLVEEIAGQYEANTGKVIVERLAGQDPLSVPGVLVSSHGPFAWGRSCLQAVANAAMLEHLAHLAALTVAIEPYPRPVSQELLDKHFLRKHGPGAYYGQADKTDD